MYAPRLALAVPLLAVAAQLPAAPVTLPSSLAGSPLLARYDALVPAAQAIRHETGLIRYGTLRLSSVAHYARDAIRIPFYPTSRARELGSPRHVLRLLPDRLRAAIDAALRARHDQGKRAWDSYVAGDALVRPAGLEHPHDARWSKRLFHQWDVKDTPIGDAIGDWLLDRERPEGPYYPRELGDLLLGDVLAAGTDAAAPPARASEGVEPAFRGVDREIARARDFRPRRAGAWVLDTLVNHDEWEAIDAAVPVAFEALVAALLEVEHAGLKARRAELASLDGLTPAEPTAAAIQTAVSPGLPAALRADLEERLAEAWFAGAQHAKHDAHDGSLLETGEETIERLRRRRRDAPLDRVLHDAVFGGGREIGPQ